MEIINKIKRILGFALYLVSHIIGLNAMEEKLYFENNKSFNKFKKNPELLFPDVEHKLKKEMQDKALAFAMATHPRLGANSLAKVLPNELFEKIGKMVIQDQKSLDQKLQKELEKWLAYKDKSRKIIIHKSNRDRIKYYQDNYLSKDSLCWAIAGYNLNDVRLFLYMGCDPNYQGLNGNTALHDVAYADNGFIAKLLLINGAYYNNCVNHLGLNPLEVASVQCSSSVVKELLKYGANPNWYYEYDQTPLLYYTVSRSSEEAWNPHSTKQKKAAEDIIKNLIFYGANPNSTNIDGFTPLHEAAKEGIRKSIVKILLDGGADPSIKATFGKYKGMTAAEIAKKNGYDSLADYINKRCPIVQQGLLNKD